MHWKAIRLKRELTIFCDESTKKGRYFSNFYGGVLLDSRSADEIEAALREKKRELNLLGEIKWEKVTKQYLGKYTDFVNYYFRLVREGRIKIRIMFTHNLDKPVGLTQQQMEMQYFILYYQMIKHSFGLAHSDPRSVYETILHLKLDQIPHSEERFADFKGFLSAIPRHRDFRAIRMELPPKNIVGVHSHDHAVLQGLDIIMGSIQFRLNDLHKEKPTTARWRGKRTRAKELLYKCINRNIQMIVPWQFNIGVSTGAPNGAIDRWTHPYRHWKFVPSRRTTDAAMVKPRR